MCVNKWILRCLLITELYEQYLEMGRSHLGTLPFCRLLHTSICTFCSTLTPSNHTVPPTHSLEEALVSENRHAMASTEGRRGEREVLRKQLGQVSYCQFSFIIPAHRTLLGYPITQPIMWPHLMCVRDTWHTCQHDFLECHYYTANLKHWRGPGIRHSPWPSPPPGSTSQSDIRHLSSSAAAPAPT